MEIQSSSIHIIIAVLVLVSIGFIVYMNYNEITLLKSKMSRALSEIDSNTRKIEELSYASQNVEDLPEEIEMGDCYEENIEEYEEEQDEGGCEEYNEQIEDQVFEENTEEIQEETVNEPGNLFGDWNTSSPPPVSYILGNSVSFKIDESEEQEEKIQEIEENVGSFGLSPSYSGCQQILKSGKNAGELCKKKVYIGSLCKQHYIKN